VGLLHAAGGRGRLPRRLQLEQPKLATVETATACRKIGKGETRTNNGGELLPGRLAAGGLAGGLLRTRHLDLELPIIWLC
jgi:hypothetical protein